MFLNLYRMLLCFLYMGAVDMYINFYPHIPKFSDIRYNMSVHNANTLVRVSTQGKAVLSIRE